MSDKKPTLDYEDPNRTIGSDEAETRLNQLTGRMSLSFFWLFRVIAALFVILFLTCLVLAIAKSLQR